MRRNMEQRLLGQDTTIRVIQDGVMVAEIAAIGNFDGSIDLEIKEDQFLGRKAADFSDVFNGYSGGLEFQTATAGWTEFADAVIARATREDPSAVFNVVRQDLYADGTSNVFTYLDVAWGPLPENFSGRKEFAKFKLAFKCSERPTSTNQL